MPRPNKGKRVGFRKDRNWWGVYEYINRQKHWHISGCASREEAEAEYAILLIGKRKNEDITVGEIMAYYLENQIPHTVDPESNGLYCHRRCSPFWAALLYKDVKASTFKRFCRQISTEFEKMHKRPPSNDTLRKLCEHMIAAFNHAFNDEIVDRVPRNWKPDKAPSRVKWLTEDEVDRLIEAALILEEAKDYLPLFIKIAVGTAARKDAILSRRWCNIDDNFIDFGTGTGNKKRPKSPIPEDLKPELRKARGGDMEYVISRKGQRMKNINKSLIEAAKRAGLGHITSHVLKHTAITKRLRKGISIYKVAEWSNTSVAVIKSNYGHLSCEDIQEVANA